MTDRQPPPPPDGDEDDALCAEYALGLLSPPEVRAFEDRMAVDPAFRAMAISWQEDMAALAAATDPVEPPAKVETALRARLFPEERQGWVRRLGVVPAAVGAFVAALLVLVATNLGILQPYQSVTPGYAGQIVAEDGSLVLDLRIAPDSATLSVQLVAGAAPAGRVLELWLIAPDAAPVSVGLLPEVGSTDLTIPESLADELGGVTFAISEEPPGGSPTGQPTGTVLGLAVLAAG